jgi:glutamate---cysteine ligase / carboxylate-amine ligase
VSFGRSAPLSLGVEEELFLVDAETLDPLPLFSTIVPEPGPRMKPELFECVVEITTPICPTAAEVGTELRCLREQVVALARPHGGTILAAGTHPTAIGAGQPIVPERRYLDLAAGLGRSVYRQLVSGLHVHVGVPDEDTCLRALEGILPWLPVLLALSANSPFAEGEDTGVRSARAGRLAELPRGGPPPYLGSWAVWETIAGYDYTRWHWDVRPHPRFGTLEVRVLDQQTSVDRSAAFAALVQALVREVAADEREPYDRRVYVERRAAAATAPPDPEALAELRTIVEPAARELGSWDVVGELLAAPSEAERQLEIGLPDVVRALADRSLQ